jgi:hypothetical protein
MKSKNSRHWSERCDSRRGRAITSEAILVSLLPFPLLLLLHPQNHGVNKWMIRLLSLSPFSAAASCRKLIYFTTLKRFLLLIYFFIATAIKKYLADIRIEETHKSELFASLDSFFFEKRSSISPDQAALSLVVLMRRG